MTFSIIIGIFVYALIIEKQEYNEAGSKEPVAVKVFINENDTIIPALSAEIKELKGMVQKIQDDTLCVTITKGNKCCSISLIIISVRSSVYLLL